MMTFAIFSKKIFSPMVFWDLRKYVFYWESPLSEVVLYNWNKTILSETNTELLD